MIRGSCLCGAVAFEITGRLSPIQYCHAERCRKASGSAFNAEAAARADQFRFIRGEDSIATYDAPLLREPPAYRRNFCRTCGSPLPVPLEGTDFVVIQAGTVDDEIDAKPFRHIFTSQAASWFNPDDDLPKFEGRPPENARLPSKRDNR
ncbi:MAG: GFA family protein [Deltaproteobacteria bacterium]|nr:GFA family protein [Deltaproteobacteria bacterium]